MSEIMDIPHGGIFICCMIFCALINIQWYRAKYFLKKNGYSMSLFSNHGKDLKNLKLLVKETNDSSIKEEAKKLLRTIYVGLFLFVGSFVVFAVFSAINR